MTQALPSLDLDLPTAFASFSAAHPGYAATAPLDALREREFGRLEASGQRYLDYTGSGLYAASQVQRHAESLLGHVLGNPHSTSASSMESTRRVERCRERVLRYFRADPAEYVVVFTANASHALKLVGEAYPFAAGDVFLLTFDNHNSVNGIREFDRLRGARTVYVPMTPPELRVDEATLDQKLAEATPGGHNLFAFPAQSNFSGVQHPLDWVRRAQERGWDVLLDAAAFVPTNRLDLSQVRPDFVALSFYKMFGYPTGVGALIARRSALAKLHRPWFAGGTIDAASVQADRFVFTPGAASFEDGTLDFANIPAVELGLDLLDEVGVELVHERVRLLSGWMLEQLMAMRHASGQPLVRLYGPDSTERRGATLALNFYDRDGRLVDHRRVEQRANAVGLSLRTGCFCNPGAGELALGLSREELERCFASSSHMTREDLQLCVDPKAAGAIRASLGLASNFADAWAFVAFARSFLDAPARG
ncbi:MAG: aminotransferase class V-fold PLP-dependent enzyme [Vicinamibacteria bacterium]|nr:aminotransferase class V-fold PLP-dependent enzyme [Vicinamibacteria bacterium]